MAQAAQRVIPHDTLIESGRVNRPPLRVWAKDLLDTLPPGAESRWDDIASSMNNAALIEVFRGDLRSARHLCDLQIRWVGNLAKVHGLTEVGGIALQPWVNIGRLLRIQRDREGALRYFALLIDTLEGKTLDLGAVTIDPDAWQEINHRKPMTGFLEAVYLIDSVKAYLSARDYTGALGFVEHARTVMSDGQAVVMDESELLALAGLARYGEAMAITERPSWQRDGYAKLMRVTYRVTLAALTSPAEQARRLVRQLMDRVLSARLEEAQDQRVLRLLDHLGRLARHVEEDELAARIGHTGLRASRHMLDAPFELTFLDMLLELPALPAGDEMPERAVLAQERETLLRECLYVPLVKARGHTVDPAALADPVFDALIARLEEIAESPRKEAGAAAGDAPPYEERTVAAEAS